MIPRSFAERSIEKALERYLQGFRMIERYCFGCNGIFHCTGNCRCSERVDDPKYCLCPYCYGKSLRKRKDAEVFRTSDAERDGVKDFSPIDDCYNRAGRLTVGLGHPRNQKRSIDVPLTSRCLV